MSRTVTIDMVECQKLKRGFAAAGTFSAVGTQNGLLQLTTLLFALLANFGSMFDGVTAAAFKMSLFIRLLPLVRLLPPSLKVFCSIVTLVLDVGVMLLFLALLDPLKYPFAVLAVIVTIISPNLLICLHAILLTGIIATSPWTNFQSAGIGGV